MYFNERMLETQEDRVVVQLLPLPDCFTISGIPVKPLCSEFGG